MLFPQGLSWEIIANIHGPYIHRDSNLKSTNPEFKK